jgi:hypothetical protein
MKRDLLIRIEPDDATGIYKARMFDVGAAGPVDPALAEGRFSASAELLALKNLLSGDAPAPMINTNGYTLYQQLNAALGRSLQDALAGPRTAIHFDLGSEELRGLPWEILVWSADANGMVPTPVRAMHDICRVDAMTWDTPQLVSNGPLRLMIAMGDSAGIGAAEEATEIRRRVQPNERAVDILQIKPANQRELYQEIKSFRPHVFHFIGHGDTGALDFGQWDWGSMRFGDIGGIALEEWKPSLVFLNACRSAEAGRSVTLGALAPLCSIFLARGAQAAIAMQGDIKGTAAGTLAGVFYEKLAAGLPIHEALSYARAAIETEFDEKQACYPALMLRCASRAALPCFHPLSEDYRKRVQLCAILPKLKVFVNQVTPRRHIYCSLWPYREPQLREPFILLRGPSSYGKTVLTGALLDLAARLGHMVRYVDIGLDPPVDFISILERIWGGPSSTIDRSPLFDPLPFSPAAEWVKRFNAANETSDVSIYAEFRQALAAVSVEKTLTIALDNFRIKNVPNSVFWYLWEHLFLHVGRDLKNVNLVVVLDDDAYRRYDVETQLTLRSHFRTHRLVELGALTADDFRSLWKEYMYFRSDDLKRELSNPLAAQFVEHYAARETGPISVAKLEAKTKDLAVVMGIVLSDLSNLR